MKWNWHHDLICHALEEVYRGRIRRLILNVPPGSTKSTIASVMFCPWVWTKDPSRRFINVSHGGNLVTRDSTAARAVLDSQRYQRAWGDKVTFAKDQNEKTRFMNTHRGYRLAFGMTSGGTGEHCDIQMFDDPHDAEKAMYSKAILEAGINAYKHKWSSRLNDPMKSSIVVIMQRLNVNDLSGYFLKRGGWHHICIPFEYEPTRSFPGDPRTTRGQFYWPDLYGQSYRDEMKSDSTYKWEGQYQQNPKPLEGGMIRLEWFNRYDFMPMEGWNEVIQFWDTAQKGDELVHSPWVCLTVVRIGESYYIKDVYRKWHNYPEGKKAVGEQIKKHKPYAIVIEDKSSGQSLLQELPREHTSIAFLPFEPEGDKLMRLGVEAPAIEAGKVWIPNKAPWLRVFEDEITSVPNADYMDQADGLSMMLKYFRTHTPYVQEEDYDYSRNTEGWPEEDEDWSLRY